MESRIPTPHIYINVHQTIAICLVTCSVAAYIFDFKGVRKDINATISAMGGAR
jgi:hypothetical protein